MTLKFMHIFFVVVVVWFWKNSPLQKNERNYYSESNNKYTNKYQINKSNSLLICLPIDFLASCALLFSATFLFSLIISMKIANFLLYYSLFSCKWNSVCFPSSSSFAWFWKKKASPFVWHFSFVLFNVVVFFSTSHRFSAGEIFFFVNSRSN